MTESTLLTCASLNVGTTLCGALGDARRFAGLLSIRPSRVAQEKNAFRACAYPLIVWGQGSAGRGLVRVQFIGFDRFAEVDQEPTQVFSAYTPNFEGQALTPEISFEDAQLMHVPADAVWAFPLGAARESVPLDHLLQFQPLPHLDLLSIEE